MSPDFLIDNTIAIEVTRLNQNLSNGAEVEGIEILQHKLNKKINGMLSKIKAENVTKSFFVSYDFTRPLNDKKEFINWMKKNLLDYLSSGNEEEATFQYDEDRLLAMSISPASRRYENVFVLDGDGGDNDEGGFMVAEMHRNLQIVSDKKTKRIDRNKYPEWWLLLIDRISGGLSEDGVCQLNEFGLEHTWDKIILVSPQRPENGIELYARTQQR